MRKLLVQSFVSADGVMQAPGGPEEDPTGGFTAGGWSTGYWDAMMGEVMGEEMSKPRDLLLGRKTYEIFAAHWPYAGDYPEAAAMNNATKYVASRSLQSLEWQNSHLLDGDATESVAKLKQTDGLDLVVVGSSNLIQSLLAAGLVDELELWVFPVVLGRGKRVFGEGAVPGSLELVATRASTTGVLINTYRPAGEIRSGSFSLPDPTEAELARRQKLASEG
jgi:dihydrofolate reductase